MAQNSPLSVDFINPFLKAVIAVIGTMANIEAKPGKPFLKEPDTPRGDVTGLIGMASKECTGSLAVIFPEACVLEIISKMLDEKIPKINDDILDGVGELTNQICGQAKKGLGEKGYRFDLAIPNVIRGSNHTVNHKTDTPVIIIPFDIPSGTFFIEASFVLAANPA